MLCGQSPVPAAQRLVSDSNPHARTLNSALPEYLSEVLELGLKLKPVERIQTVPQLFKALSSQEYTSELTRTLPKPAPRTLTLPEEEQKKHGKGCLLKKDKEVIYYAYCNYGYQLGR